MKYFEKYDPQFLLCLNLVKTEMIVFGPETIYLLWMTLQMELLRTASQRKFPTTKVPHPPPPIFAVPKIRLRMDDFDLFINSSFLLLFHYSVIFSYLFFIAGVLLHSQISIFFLFLQNLWKLSFMMVFAALALPLLLLCSYLTFT